MSVRRPRKTGHIGLVVGLCLAPVLLCAQSDHVWRVVVLHPTSLMDSGSVAVNQGIRAAFTASQHPFEFYPESFELNRFPAFESDFVQLLSKKYASVDIDVVLVNTGYGIDFLARHPGLWPKAEIVFFGLEERALSNYKIAPNMTGQTTRMDIEGTLDLAFHLQPKAKQVVITGGAYTSEQYFKDIAIAHLKRKYPRVGIRVLNDLPFRQQLSELRKLSPDTIVLYVQFYQDVTGQAFQTGDIQGEFSRASNAPIYTWKEDNLGTGFVGGRFRDVHREGESVGRLAIRVLNGEPAGSIPVQPSPPSRTVVDWRQMQRWRIPESALPPGVEVINREPSLWRDYKPQVIGAGLVFLLQTLLTIVMLVNRARRRAAETNLRESESRFKRMAESAPVAIWMTDRKGRFEWANRRWLDIQGHSLEEQLGQTWTEGIHPEDRDRVLSVAASAAEAHGVYTQEYRVRRHDGRYRWLLSACVPRIDGRGEFVGYIASSIDVSDRKEAELESQRNHAQLTHLSRLSLMGELVASLAHELNQPLAAIRANAEGGLRLVDRDPPDLQEALECFRDIVRDDHRAGEIITNLRGLAKKQEPVLHPVDLGTIVSEVVELVHGDALMHRVSVSIDLQQPLPPILGDRIELQQVLLNLLLNAFAAMRDASGTVREVRVSVATEGPKNVRVAVRDSGTGLTRDQLDHIFKPFFTTKSEGLGLGLSICKSIVEFHNGRLWAENNADRGATFYLSIPATADVSGGAQDRKAVGSAGHESSVFTTASA